MPRTPKPAPDSTPKPRASRGKSGKPPPPPAERAGGTPETKRSAAAGFAEAPQAPFLPAAASEFAAPAAPSAGRSTLPALRNTGPPSRNFADMTASLNALLAKPAERSERAREVLSQQPMMAAHPLVSGGMPAFTPHRPPRPEKSEGGIAFQIVSDMTPKGDQPAAIDELVAGVEAHERNQVLLGVTGSGKTFTAAQVIARTQRPALVLAPNKTLAAQLYGEFKSFFPDNAVEYFVSYYDYYQPEAYVPRTDTYIEKESSVNEQIDRMRHAATRSLLERDDVIIVASVSCIYGIGSVETYTAMTFTVQVGESLPPAPAAGRPGRPALPPQRRQLHPRHLPRARRHRRAVPGAFGGPRLAHLAVRRRGREHHRVRSAHRPEERRAEADQGLLQLALRHAQADAAAGHQVHQDRAEAAAGRAATPPAGCWRRSGWSSAPSSTWR